VGEGVKMLVSPAQVTCQGLAGLLKCDFKQTILAQHKMMPPYSPAIAKPREPA